MPNGPGHAEPHRPGRAVRVLIVDDSAVVREMLSRELSKDPEIRVVGAAGDPYEARDRVVELNPDVLTLDIEMPRMDGVTFLRHLMTSRPMPVIVLSSLTQAGTATALEALAAGAVDVLGKPGSSHCVDALGPRLCAAVKLAARSNVRAESAAAAAPLAPAHPTNTIMALGASTGGVQALTRVLTALPANAPGAVVVQHMPARFTASFAARLNRLCRVRVTEATDGDRITPGRVLIAPGGRHMVVARAGLGFRVGLKDGPEVFHQRPSVDVLFHSVADAAGPKAVGAILTGMGADGATGLLAMRRAGAGTVAQSRESCVVFGMPGEAVKCGAAEHVVPLDRIASTLLSMCAGAEPREKVA
jgi:two-component system chemotaxis response regulator CheB